MKRMILVFVALALLGGAAFSQQTQMELRRQTFEIVWSRVKEKHFDPQLGGVDWEAARQRYEPRVAAGTDKEFHRLLNEMLGELRQSHFAVFPPEVYAGEENKAARAEVGMEAQMIEGRPTVTRVEPTSPAAEAGLRPGYVLTGVGDESMDELLRRIAARGERTVAAQALLLRALRSRLRGEADSTVVVRYLDHNNAPRAATLRRRSLDGPSIKFGEFPALRGQIESRRLAGGVGYLRFNLFLLPLLAPVREAMKSLSDAPGVVLDLRGNSGGEIAVTTAVAGLFCAERTTLGSTRLRQGELHRLVFPSETAYAGPLVILTDEGTVSAAETFAAAMQENGRARIVGRPTAGGALPSVIEKLPTGARLQYAVGEYRTPKGVALEGRGVTPDAPVAVTRRALLEGRDPILEKAISVALESQRQNKTSRPPARHQ